MAALRPRTAHGAPSASATHPTASATATATVPAPAPGDHPPDRPGAPAHQPSKARHMAGTYGRAVVRVLPAWIAARVLVVVSLILAHLVVTVVRPHNPAAVQRVHQGLLAWDGGWYAAIGGHGYAAAGTQAVRFFPGYPMAARGLAWIPGISVGTALVVISNVCALAAMGALLILVRHDLDDRNLARRSVWLMALAPSAYCLVMGYADAALLLFSVVTVLGARTGRWWWAAAAGLGAGLVRPVGVLLVVPVVIELWQSRRTATTTGSTPGPAPAPATITAPGSGLGGWTARGAAVLAPLAGMGAYLAWVGHQFGDPWLPLRIQQEQGHRGSVTVPLAAMGHTLASLAHGHHLGSALHIPWVLLCVVLLVVAYRRLPLSYAALATAMLAVSLTSTNLDSFERYALGAFPLVVAASTLTSHRRVEVVVLVLSGLAMVGYAFLAFVGVVVP